MSLETLHPPHPQPPKITMLRRCRKHPPRLLHLPRQGRPNPWALLCSLVSSPAKAPSTTLDWMLVSVTVRIVDRCAGCQGKFDLDFSPAAFNALADPNLGRIDFPWHSHASSPSYIVALIANVSATFHSCIFTSRLFPYSPRHW
ncbi:hypothetical protein BS47DRAFT_68472 [Hydnum rufescens UP504]|uniref:Uncharacterized protein n=1 Tax=Hydnum rufescens UP504 TaxID=1448309 RepID=A0A9P6DTD9_9AGAM|nr:hypothetical protein BS47DRAFT_68472 [Hydnum rufescens UP504]